MPHLTLEYSQNIRQKVNFKDLFSGLHQILAAKGGVKIENCKSRAVRRDEFHIGNGERTSAFIHLELSMLEGRSVALKQEVGREILEFLREYYAPSIAEHDLQITVEIKDIHRSTYFKIPENSLTPMNGSG